MASPSTPPRTKPSPSKSQKQATPQPQALLNWTPVRKSLQGSEHFSSHLSNPEAVETYRDPKVVMARELGGQWVGPMPVEDFISEFLPLAEDILKAMPNFSPNFFAPLVVQTYESSMYDPFIEIISTSAAITGFKLVNTSQNPDRDAVTGMKNKPDVSCYKSTVDVSKRPTQYDKMEMIFEFKPANAQVDPFEDDPSKNKDSPFPFESQTDGRMKCRGQIACYARVWCARQHRIHCFIMYIGDPSARIIRIDRSGGIVSGKFDYRTHGHLLLQFLWRFSQSTPEARGLDTTISVASKGEAAKVKDHLYKWRPTSRRNVLNVQVPDPIEGNEKNTRSLFVWGPLADPRSVTGRATRVYPAFDPEANEGKGQVVIIKDAWRSCEDHMEKETDILKELNDNSCRNVPQLICGDDIPGHLTLTKRYASEAWNIGARVEDLVKRVHIRFAEDLVGYKLTSCNSSREFFQAVYDAILAHKDAYEKCGILHRDISSGNIMIKEGGGGILNDWDLSKHINGPEYARQKFRSGTWQFMAARLLKDPQKLNDLQDDLESYFWVVAYYMMRYMNNNLKRSAVGWKMFEIFDREIVGELDEWPTGGDAKTVIFTAHQKGNHLDDKFAVPHNLPLSTFFREMLRHWRKWYKYCASYDDSINEFLADNETLTLEDAQKEIPFDSDSLAMRNYDALIAACETALSQEWPVGDFPVDLVPETSLKRPKSDSDNQTDEENAGDEKGNLEEEGEEADPLDDGSDSDSDGAPYKRRRHDEDPDYRFRGQESGSFTSRLTRAQKRNLDEGSLQATAE